VELLELATSSRPPDWWITREGGQPPAISATLLGEETVYDAVVVRSYSDGDVLRLEFDDTGTFDIRPATRRVAWYPGANTSEAAIRADLLGRVIAFAAHADGHLTLHASAVSIDGRAIAFVGPKHAGKSTLALALVREGARLLTDDLLVVRMGRTSGWAQPGVQRVRLWEDSARALDAAVSGEARGKPTVDRLTADELEPREAPLDACYVLEAAPEGSSELVTRVRLASVPAALACVRFSKLGALAGGPEGPVILDRAGELTRVVPVFQALVRRDLPALEQTAAAFIAWHSAARSSVTGGVR
jgi:hypothetical protein